ncbi:hypothetical protein CN223_32935, partial [Sinorhizobium meliloti]|uniref:hypothetical protein n=1 Tax=Rhizobium meliloti TaxID=382 RepID=UPI000FE0AB4C
WGRHHLGIRGRLFLGIGGRDHFGIRGRIASEFALIHAFDSRSDIITDHVASIRHISGKEHGRRKGFYQITIEGPRFSGTWNFFSGELEDLVNSITPA